MSRPWMKFFPADWRADPKLRMCSRAARGLWIDLISGWTLPARWPPGREGDRRIELANHRRAGEQNS